jgi:hypothetical protein
VLRVQALQNKTAIWTGAGFAYFVTTQIPEINPDFRILNTVDNKILTWRISDKKTVLNQRFRVEERFIHNANSKITTGKYFSWRLDTACKLIILLEKKNQL